MGTICSACTKRETYTIALVGTDEEKRTLIYKYMTKGQEPMGKYQETRLTTYKNKYDLVTIHTDDLTMDVWEAYLKFSKATFFVCNLASQPEFVVEKVFEEYVSNFIKNNYIIVVVCYSDRMIRLFENYSELNSFKLVMILPGDDDVKKFKEAFNWMEKNIKNIKK